ncbi:sugar kinase [Vibrio sp. SM6]|uniref:Sugar kinase n=1 Tax=Vibrio agarilyticus TaxID=2726741 RepID=A0A7X8YFS9_9VIBR|nr:sugar kinase [Vibrio agarilyticus]NLS11979.1 sugar kinase [Vibrio agarilyticus]
MKRIAVLGEGLVEVQGAAHGLKIGYGGDAINTAIALAHLGQMPNFSSMEISFFSAFGTEEKSSHIVEQCALQGVDMSHTLRIEDKHAGLYLIESDANGARYCSYWRDNSAARFWFDHLEDEQIFDILKDYSLVYLTGVTLGIQTSDNLDRLLALIAQLRRAGCTICFASHYHDDLWPCTSSAQKAYQRMLALTDIALMTFEDNARLFGDPSSQAVMTRVLNQGVTEVALMDGAQSWACLAGQSDTSPASSETLGIDEHGNELGMAEAFNAAYLAARLNGQSLEQALRFGQASADNVRSSSNLVADAPQTVVVA